MNSDSSFTIHGDEPVEARIVSWVLGEASAFEAAELERLCEERPELLVFKRRMLALHGLLAEAEKPRADELWKLPPDKRKVLDEIFGEEKTVPLEEEKEKRIRHSGRRAFLAIAACLVLTVIVMGLLAPKVMMQRKKPDAAASREAESNKDLVALSTEFPPELIEGTPRPMDVEGLDQAVAGPAGWSSRARQKKVGRTDSRFADKDQSKEVEMLRRPGGGANSDQSAKSGAPASSMAKVVNAATTSPTAVPVPDVELSEPSLGFGSVDDFGLGLSDASGIGGGVSGNKQVAGNASGAKRAPTSSPKSNTAFEADPFTDDGIDFGRKMRDRNGRDGRGIVSESSGPEQSAKAGVIREFRYPTEYEPPGFSNAVDALAAGSDGFPKTPATPQSWFRQKEERAKQLPAIRGAIVDGREDAPEGGPVATLQLRKGLSTLSGANSDGILNGGGEIAGQDELSDKSEMVDENGDPTLGDMPASGDLFGRDSKNKEGSELLAEVVDGQRETAPPADRPGTTNGRTEKKGDVDQYKLKVADPDKRSGGVEGEIHAGYSNQFSFRGTDLDSPDEEAKPASGLVEREMIRRQPIVAESDKHLAAARSDYSTGDYQKAYETYEKALSLLPAAPLLEERRDFLRKSLGEASVALSISAEKAGQYEESKQWLNKAREWDPSNAQARKQLIAHVSSEIPAAEDPYSTFSLNISDASFQVAQAALAKGEQPDPAGIKVEQFYNAVDYGDPSPSAGEPVAVSIEQSAHPVIPGRNLVRIALKTAAAGRSASQPLRLTLLVDQSGSMVREDRRAAMDKALAGLSELLTKSDLVTVIGFSRTPHLLADGMTGDKADKLAELVNQAASEGGTNLEEAIKLGEQLASRQKPAGAQNRIVLFTDGAANLGNADPDRLAEHVKQLRQKGIAFDIAGIAADGLNDELLGELARNGNGRYYVVGKGADSNFAKQLAGAFRPAAENVKVQVHFNPERVGRYKLIGFEKDRLKTEDFRNDKVDAGELAAEEAGVAIYQVEPLPGGRGELGEVSVRFRDTASDQMVERSWTIPHDESAPGLDRATPSMQLAVLSMLAGEKLKGGPLAEAIDFKQLSASAANVKQFYGNTGRIGEMLRMVDVLK